MSRKEKIVSPCKPRLVVLQAKRQAIFERVNVVYNQAKVAHISEENEELFLNSCITIEEIRTSFHNVLDDYNEMLLENDPDAIPSYQSYASFEDLYCFIKQVQSKFTKHDTATVVSTTPKAKQKLPQLELMSFNGDLNNWPLFYTTFNALVHTNDTLTNADKLYYLLGKLSHNAQSTFAGVIPTPENYDIIYQTLVDKYQDIRLLGTNHLEQALNFKLNGSPSASNYQSFIDTFVVAINSLKSLKIDDLLDFILLHIAIKKFDTETVRAFQMYSRDMKKPTLDMFINFIRSQCRIYGNTQPADTGNNSSKSSYKPRVKTLNPPNPQSYVTSSSRPDKCPLCNYANHDHYYKCTAFERLSPTERFKYIKNNNACVNCLSRTHKTVNCTSKLKCRTCNQRHHSMLHFNINRQPSEPVIHNLTTAPPQETRPVVTQAQIVQRNDMSLCTTSVAASLPSRIDVQPIDKRQQVTCATVLLSTAQVVVYSADNKPHLIRCLLDSASQSDFISYECCKRLGLLNHTKPSNMVVKGIGGSEKQVKGSVNIKIHSKYNSNVYFSLDSLIIDRISDPLPSVAVDKDAFTHLNSLPLADENYAIPGPIDCLVGASTFSHLILPGVVNSQYDNVPPAIQTVLGFVIMGTAPTSQIVHNNMSTLCCSVAHDSIDSQLKRFWELEEISTPPAQNPDDVECEEYFRATTVRETSGRYVVALPFRNDAFLLGDSYATALKRLQCLERKLDASLKIRAAYNDVIRDYINKGYLSPIIINNDDVTRPSYTIPHHGVYRDDKSSTKLRCVLDASCKSAPYGYSLNDILHAGPNLQGDLFSILINFRLFEVTLSADCRQMFLQIIVREQDRRYQRILYRFSTDEPVTVFQFNRVCFGIKSSPFHALRVVRQLIADEGDKFPAAAAAASSFLYMDDIVLSVMTTEQATTLSYELTQLFKMGQFDLVKWTSNSDVVLSHIPDTNKDPHDKIFNSSAPHKILGLYWDRSHDCFRFIVAAPDNKCTKRTILSAIARLWDIMGYVAPAILYAKLLIKELWLSKCDWDAEPPRHIVCSWMQFCAELPSLNKLCIPRHLGIVQNCEVNIIGFADASERAYGGVAYLQVRVGSDYTVKLVCAKSKVSPVKVVSVARLELCAAVLLSQLLRKVADIITPRYFVSNVYAFSDSKVVLCWINGSPHRWQTFVSNRVVKLTENIPADRFFHISGSSNPADCLSRGLTPDQLADHPLWYNGPPWAKLDPSEWPSSKLDNKLDDEYVDIPEQRTMVHVLTNSPEENSLYVLAQRFSSYSKLLRVIVYVYRFVKKLPRANSISATDLEFAENKLICAVQDVYFSYDKARLTKNEICSPALNKLRPFIDSNGVIRVGGRLSNSAEDFTHKHPSILPRHDHIIDLIVDHYHRKHLHAGPELLMSLLRQRFWILAARRIIRYRTHKCNVCFRSKPRPSFPLMADLPSHRVNQVDKVFTHVGCDYAGPLQYTPVRGRGVKSRKAWLCIFTCLTTRATHIEIATDLSTASFLNAFKRFLSRRGPIKCMYSDNGTCFIGARSYLRDLYKFLDEFRTHLEGELAENRITWKLIPPSSPHWGACWESMVKIVKTILFKVIGQQVVSYEELLTVLAQVEALINSRPLTVMSSDPAEPSALTPAHFLQTVPLSSIPAPNVEQTDLRQRHSLLDSMVQSFWKRWRVEYLHQLQSRAKWNVPSVPIQEGTVVIVITDNAPPFAWPLGVVEKVYPSKDGTTRVVTIKTAKGRYLRPVVKLCPLPNQ